MTTNFYFTHPIAASFDPRIHALEEKLHGKGYGLYWYIREKLSYFPQKCCRLENLKPFATKYYTYRLIQKVVLESDLFEIEEGYIIPLKLTCEGGTIDEEATREDTTAKPQRGNKKVRKNNRTEAKNSRKQTKNSENPSVSDENPLKNDENPSKNSEKQAFFDEKQAENGKKRTKNDEKQAIFNEKQAFFDGKQAKNSVKQVRKTSRKQPEHTNKQEFTRSIFETNDTNTPIYINKEKEKERKYISSTEKEEEEEKEQEQEKTENAVNDRNVPVQHPLPPRAATGRTPHIQRPPHPRQRPSTSRRPLPVERPPAMQGTGVTSKKPPHLRPHPLGFAGTLPRIRPAPPRGIGQKPHGNQIQSPGQSNNLEFRVSNLHISLLTNKSS